MRIVAHLLRPGDDGLLELLEGGEGVCEAFEGGHIPELCQCLVYSSKLGPQDRIEFLLTSRIDKDCEARGGVGHCSTQGPVWV